MKGAKGDDGVRGSDGTRVSKLMACASLYRLYKVLYYYYYY